MKWLSCVVVVAIGLIWLQGTAFTDAEFSEIVATTSRKLSSNNCERTWRRLVIDVGVGGLGNRMLAIVSALQLAMKMNRVLEVKWDLNRGCNSEYSELFRQLRAIQMVAGERAWAPFHVGKSRVQHQTLVNETLCKMSFWRDFDETINGKLVHYHHMNILKSKSTFSRVNLGCDTIELRANEYFNHLVMGKNLFQSPFRDAAMILFQPQFDIQKEADRLIHSIQMQENGKRATWLSIHARQLFTKGGDLEKSFECANKLLNDGEIQKVFFATDSELLLRDAGKFIEKKDALVTVKNVERLSHEEYIREGHDNFKLRDEKGMRNAVLEWFVLGEADYCLSPSDELSTYSKTAIARSYCKYIDYQEGKHCDVSKATTNTEFLLRTTTTDEDYNFDIPTQLTSDEVFDSVEKSFVENMEACVDTDGKEDIEEYWEKQISFHEHENGNRHF